MPATHTTFCAMNDDAGHVPPYHVPPYHVRRRFVGGRVVFEVIGMSNRGPSWWWWLIPFMWPGVLITLSEHHPVIISTHDTIQAAIDAHVALVMDIQPPVVVYPLPMGNQSCQA